jgi:4'-phosphopantetheinyl transferase
VPDPIIALAPGAVDVWTVLDGEIDVPGTVEACLSLLSPAELAEAGRRSHSLGRQEYIITRGLVRSALSRYAPVPARVWEFRANDAGRPEIGWPATDLRFSVSHTPGLTALAVVRGAIDVGIDVEKLGPHPQALDLARSSFAPAPVQELARLPEGTRDRRFLEHWTLAEAYVKARGRGFGLPLDGFWFELEPSTSPRVRFGPKLGDESSRWQFRQVTVQGSHLLAVAAAVDAPLVVKVRRCVPPRRFE